MDGPIYRTYFILNFITEAHASDFNFRDFLNDQNLMFVKISFLELPFVWSRLHHTQVST